MKSIKVLFPFLMLTLFFGALKANDDGRKTEVVYIQTSAQCGGCKTRIEAAVNELKGVKKAELNLTDKKLMVVYSPDKITPAAIKLAVAKAGYDADDVVANQTAYDNLPACCKKGGMEKH